MGGEKQKGKEEEYEKWKRRGRICDRIVWEEKGNKNKREKYEEWKRKGKICEEEQAQEERECIYEENLALQRKNQEKERG